MFGSPLHFAGATLASVRRSSLGVVVDRLDAVVAEQIRETSAS